MAARLIGLIASRGDDLRAQLLAHGALDGLMTALGAMDAVASAGGPLPVLFMRLRGHPLLGMSLPFRIPTNARGQVETAKITIVQLATHEGWPPKW